jgi:hypothetical protein
MSRLALPRKLGIARNLRLSPSVSRISAAPYLGQVATRSAVANFMTAANTQFNSRTSHTMRTAVSSFQVVFPNWYVDGSFVEVGPGADATITASIEYPAGTFTQIKFSGSASGTVPNGGNLISDPISLSIPSGGQFFIRTFWNNPAGIFFLYANSADPVGTFLANNYTGEAMDVAASGLTDMTLGGTITDNAPAAAYRPVAIIGTTTQPSVLLLGDSRQFGIGNAEGAGSAANVPQGEWAGSIDPLFGYINCGIPADQANLFVASSPANRLALGQYCSHIGCEYGINDLDLSGFTSSQLIATIQSIISLFPGKPFFQSTLDPYANPGNTAPGIPAANTQRIAFNTALRNGTTGLTGLTAMFDIASVTESSLNSGLWVSSYSTDYLHPNSIGYPAITSSGVINTELIHRP